MRALHGDGNSAIPEPSTFVAGGQMPLELITQMPLGATSPYGAETVALLHHLQPGVPLAGQAWAQALGTYFSKVWIWVG